MPQIKTGNIPTRHGYDIYLDELDLRNPEQFVRLVISGLASGNPNYIKHLDQVGDLDPDAFAALVLHEAKKHYDLYKPYLADAEQIACDEYAIQSVRDAYAEHITYEINTCYAIRADNHQREMAALMAQIAIDEIQADAYLTSVMANELADELAIEAATKTELFEFFGPDYTDGLFPADTTAELDQVLATAVPTYRKNLVAKERRRKTALYQDRVRYSALRAQQDIDKLMSEDARYTTNCGGFITRPKKFRLLGACRIWRRAEKMHLVSGLIATRMRYPKEKRLRYLKHPPKRVLRLEDFGMKIDQTV